MGISANQARLMTLTARQSDLELRAQQISAVKMRLAMQQQSVATEYSNALNQMTTVNSLEDNKYYFVEDGEFVEAPQLHFVQAYEQAGQYDYVFDQPNFSMMQRSTGDTRKYNAIVVKDASVEISRVNTRYQIQNYAIAKTGAQIKVDIENAQSKYDSSVQALAAEEKLLDLELTQINTEHSAVKTEYDSIKSLVKDNIDKSFNIFG